MCAACKERSLAGRGLGGDIAGTAGGFDGGRWRSAACRALRGGPGLPARREKSDVTFVPPVVHITGCSGCPARLSCGGERGPGVFPRLTTCKSCGPRKLSGGQQDCHKTATVACRAGGPGACAPPTAALGGRLAPPRVRTEPGLHRGRRAGGRGWRARGRPGEVRPTPRPGNSVGSAGCAGCCVCCYGSGRVSTGGGENYSHLSLKVPRLEAKGRFL